MDLEELTVPLLGEYLDGYVYIHNAFTGGL